jgi:two-component SAPR family response regulator
MQTTTSSCSTPKNPPKIFTTAYREYAPERFDLNAVDYLIIPISFEPVPKINK